MKWYLVLLAMWSLSPTSAAAFTLSPMSQVVTPKGTRSACSYEVTNPGSKPIAIEFWVAHLHKNLDGSEDLSQPAIDFAVFPPQLVLEPGGTQTIRVRWLGDSAPESELSFRFMAEQVPVDLERPDTADGVHAQLSFHYNYHGTLFVRPRHAQPDVDIEDIELIRKDSTAMLRLRVHNDGTTRGWVRRFVLRVEIDGERHVLTEQELPTLENLPVLAGGSRELLVPWPTGLPEVQPTSASLSVTY